MHNSLLSMFLLVSLSWNMSAAALELNASMPAADIQMQNASGDAMSLSQLKGDQGKLIVFSCNTCPYARAWEERLVAIGNEYQDQGFAVAVINSNDPQRDGESLKDMQRRVKAKGYRFAYLADANSSVARAFGATRTPEVYLFDANNKLIYQGAIDDNADNAKQVKQPYLRQALAALKTQKPINPATTKAVGCGIKFVAQK